MNEDDFTGSMDYVMTIDRTLKEAPIAEFKVDTPYYTGVAQAICLRDPLFDLVIGNIPGARNPDNLVPFVETRTSAVKLLRRLRKAELTAKPSKCVCGAESVGFREHHIGRDWITFNEDNLEKNRAARRPTTKKEVRSFWGLANYYRAHIPTFAAVAAPLTDLTCKGQLNKIRWGQAQEKAFSSLQDYLLKRPI